jgi:hypothetical protein
VNRRRQGGGGICPSRIGIPRVAWDASGLRRDGGDDFADPKEVPGGSVGVSTAALGRGWHEYGAYDGLSKGGVGVGRLERDGFGLRQREQAKEINGGIDVGAIEPTTLHDEEVLRRGSESVVHSAEVRRCVPKGGGGGWLYLFFSGVVLGVWCRLVVYRSRPRVGLRLGLFSLNVRSVWW